MCWVASSRFELVIVRLKVGEEMGTIAEMANEVPQDRGLEVETPILKAIEIESGGEKVPQMAYEERINAHKSQNHQRALQ